MIHQWRLYGTLGCHLCKQAQAIIENLRQSFDIQLELFDIACDAQTVAKFGERIPVLENKSNQQMLDWPFDLERLSDWLDPPQVPENKNNVEI
ncbi:glutaredoxin family protein [Marinagarivorans cellulosilyticus]|uniref:Glutaredoxin family protein n=1 Tax=Marinagarivorans cellulosilyticus TaxID=2721545 RepID=A0AAN1WKQ5_9GAMM|nr:glutaredoxin family protein [Marinagarivorans cellulosilyticus]BCD99374.1 hypothetical protein MARGE09_P3576 [Marinagarivorans cellulosilyticus]